MRRNGRENAFHHSASVKKRFRKYFFLYIMIIPPVAYMIVNNYMPMYGLCLAFKNYSFAKGIIKSEWTGFSNFTYMFSSKWAGIMFRNTILYNLTFIVLGTAFAIFVAILLNEIRSQKLKNVTQILILIPHLVSMVLVGYIVYAFLSGTNGFINKGVLEPIGAEPVSWYTEPRYWPFVLVLVHLWKSFGFSSIIYFATIIGFDRSYYEAAAVDGAGPWQQIFRITLPLLKPTVIIMLIMAIGRIFSTDFGLFYQVPMNAGPLHSVTTTIDTFVYRALMENHDVGRSLAAGFTQSVHGFILVIGTNAAVRKIEPENALY